MRRRDFIAALGGAAAAWPLAARAQPVERMRRIGVLNSLPADDPEAQARHAAFLQGLQEFGWAVGRNVRIDSRWGAGDADRIGKMAAELAAQAPDVILATGGITVAPLLKATRTVPIVFVIVPDPVGAGFIESLARPGGNATGFLMLEFGLSGTHSQGREARRPTGAGADEVPACHQSEDRQGTRPHGAADAACARR